MTGVVVPLELVPKWKLAVDWSDWGAEWAPTRPTKIQDILDGGFRNRHRDLWGSPCPDEAVVVSVCAETYDDTHEEVGTQTTVAPGFRPGTGLKRLYTLQACSICR